MVSYGPEKGEAVEPIKRGTGGKTVRYVVPPVSNPAVFISTKELLNRPSKQLDHTQANQRWWFGVQFDSEADIMMFEKAVSGSPVRLVEMEGRLYVEDPAVPDTATMGNVLGYVEERLPHLNAAVRLVCPHYVSARLLCVVELFIGGVGRSIISTTVTHHGKLEHSQIAAFLEGPGTDAPAIIDLGLQNRDVAEALHYFGLTDNVWANLYKMCEIVEESCGGKEQLFQLGWCSRSSWDRFKRTANHQEAIGRFSRHAKSKAVPPPKPMSEEQARTFAGELLNRLGY